MSDNIQISSQSTKILEATHSGKFKIGNIEVSCAVLKDGTRIFTANSVFTLFGKSRRGINDRFILNGSKLPPFLALKRLESLLTEELLLRSKPIRYLQNGKEKCGYHALLLPEMCDFFIAAKNNGLLTEAQMKMVQYAEILLSSLARIGAVAMIDEATGYQSDREKDALQKIFDKYLQPYARTWQKTFKNSFFEKLFHLYDVKLTSKGKPPLWVGCLINRIVYDRLAPHITDKLKELNPSQENNLRKHKHHQFLTEKDGLQELKEHLIKVETLMYASKNKEEFEILIDKIVPKPKITSLVI